MLAIPAIREVEIEGSQSEASVHVYVCVRGGVSETLSQKQATSGGGIHL
jgi:hypothetical protein